MLLTQGSQYPDADADDDADYYPWDQQPLSVSSFPIKTMDGIILATTVVVALLVDPEEEEVEEEEAKQEEMEEVQQVVT